MAEIRSVDTSARQVSQELIVRKLQNILSLIYFQSRTGLEQASFILLHTPIKVVERRYIWSLDSSQSLVEKQVPDGNVEGNGTIFDWLYCYCY